MESAELERTTVDIAADIGGDSKIRRIDLRATGQVVRFDGFLKLYQEGKDDEDDEEGGRLPPMQAGDLLKKERIEAAQHFTEPPPRYTEATLVKRMEELGIGRPSTYASTLAVLRDRDYVRIDKKRLVPEDKGRLLTAFLEGFFTRYVEYNFTADLEEKLDEVSNHTLDWKQILRDFWRDFSAALDGIKDLRTTAVLDSLNDLLGPHIFPAKEDGSNPRACPSCGNGQLSLKLGKFGAFIGCSNYPECKFTRTMSASGADQAALVDGERPGVRVLGVDPATQEEISLRDGRFGTYLQLGEGDKPKRSSLPKTIAPVDLTLEQAIALLSLPREVAKHPESREPIVAGIGRYGPYVQHGRTYASLGKDDDILSIGANRAIDLIVAKESVGSRFGNGAGRVLGEHPDGGAVTVKAGRFGPYVTHGNVNATLPRGTPPEALTLEEALALLHAKGTSGGGSSGRVVGEHPDGGPIHLRDGRFGAYVSHGKVNATLPKSLKPEDVTLADAIDLIDAKGGAARRQKHAKKPRQGGGRQSRQRKRPLAPAKRRPLGKRPRRPHLNVGSRRRLDRDRNPLPSKQRQPGGKINNEEDTIIEKTINPGEIRRQTHAEDKAPQSRGQESVTKTPGRPKRAAAPGSALPSRADILAFIAREKESAAGAAHGKIGKREIARAFGIKGADRIALKRLLKELEAEGIVERRHKALQKRRRHLPAVVLADITGRDGNGELIAVPVEWDAQDQGPAPKIVIHLPRKPRPGMPTPGVGDRALLRTERNHDAERGDPPYTGRVVKLVSRAKMLVLGIFRAAPMGGGRLVPVEKKNLKQELLIPPGAEGEAQDGDLVAVDILREGRFGLPAAKVRERLGSMGSERAISKIAVAAHGIPDSFERDVLAEAEAARPATLEGREDWRALALVTIDPPDAKDHDDAVHATPDPDPDESRRLHSHSGDRRCRPLCAAGPAARPRSFGTRQFGLFSRPCRADAAGAHFQRSLLAAAGRRPAGHRRPHDHHGRRSQAPPHVPPHHDALGSQALLPAGASRNRRRPR